MKKKVIIISVPIIFSVMILSFFVFWKNINGYINKKVEIESGDKISTGLNKDVSVPISIDPKGKEINAIELYLKFNPEELEIISINNADSFIELWISGEPKYDNSKGDISLAVGLPTPGINKVATVGKIVVKPKKRGKLKIDYKDSSRVLLNDGLGTSVEVNYKPIIINVD